MSAVLKTRADISLEERDFHFIANNFFINTLRVDRLLNLEKYSSYVLSSQSKL
jgi:hypothetical protein